MLRAAKHQGKRLRVALRAPFENVRKQLRFALRFEKRDGLVDFFDGRTVGRNRNVHGIFHDGRGELPYLAGKRRRKEKRLPLFGELRHDSADVGNKAHIEHSVGLVEHEIFHAAEFQLLLLPKVEKPAGGSYENVHADGKRLYLRILGYTSVHFAVGEMQMLSVNRDIVVYLLGELAGGGENQRAETPGLRICAARLEHLHYGQRERRRLAGASLGAPEDVAAFEDFRHGKRLYRRRRFVPRGADGPEDWFGKV